MQNGRTAIYSAVDPHSLILRDHLALDRTIAANERTLLAYFRTSLMLLATGFSLVKIFPEDATLVTVGSIIIPIAILLFIFGFWRFLTLQKDLTALRKISKT